MIVRSPIPGELGEIVTPPASASLFVAALQIGATYLLWQHGLKKTSVLVGVLAVANIASTTVATED